VNKLIYLVGMPGAGKTTWGRIWAVRAGREFFDLDEVIECETGSSIAVLFEKGEPFFREAEAAALLRLSTTVPTGAIIATGGGTVTTENCRNILRHGFRVFIDAEMEILQKRLSAGNAVRPLLAGYDSASRLQALYESRIKWYREADLCLQEGDLKEDTIDLIIAACTDQP
jgi:shikimate kinase